MRNLSILSLLAVAAASRADTLNLTGLSFGGNTGQLALSGVSGMADNTYFAGPFDASLNGGGAFRVFCADLLHGAAYNAGGGATVKDTSTLGAGYQQAARLLNKYTPLVGDDTVKNAALQAAVWKSIFPTLAYKDGTAGVSALADSYLASPDLASYSARATYYDLGGANQSMIRATPVPEPASLAALGMGALGLLRRRAKRA